MQRKVFCIELFYLWSVEKNTVLVCSGCCNKTPQTEYLISNRNLFLSILEARKSKIKTPAWSHASEHPLLGSWP